MKKEEFKKLLEKHKNNITTVRQWDVYAKKYTLPSSQTLIATFGSWTNLKKEMDIRDIDRKTELIEIASKHLDMFTTIENWNKYAKENDLPNGYTYIAYFSSWNSVKDKLNLPPSSPYPSIDEKKEEMISVLKEHGAEYKDRTEWDKYAKQHSLPTYKTLRKYLTLQEVKALIPKEIRYNYSKEELIKIAKSHLEHFSSMGKWNKHAVEHGLPNAATYHRKFGSWKKAKIEVFRES